MVYCSVTDNGIVEYQTALEAKADRWVPACGGSEVAYVDSMGRKVLYVYNHATGKHGYLDVRQDIVYENDNLLYPVR